MKSKYYKDFSFLELEVGHTSMLSELEGKPRWIKRLFTQVWNEFHAGEFSYDGATFVRERYPNTIFEVASFIHDWFNSKGLVGKKVDKLFIIIMKDLGYNKIDIKLRTLLMNLTFLNVLRHKYILKDYKGDIKITNYIK